MKQYILFGYISHCHRHRFDIRIVYAGTQALTDSMVVLVAPMMTHWIVMELQSPEAGGLIPIVAGKILFRHVSNV